LFAIQQANRRNSRDGDEMNKTVLITGANGKLGTAIAHHLAAAGVDLVLTSRNIESCKRLADDLSSYPISVRCISLDLLAATSFETLAERCAKENICITHIVSNARSLEALTIDETGLTAEGPFQSEVTVDVIAPYRLVMSFAKSEFHNLKSIVNIGSQYGEVAPNIALYGGDLSQTPIQYGVAKAALHHLTRELSVRLAPDIRVNCVAFGGFSGRADQEFEKRYAKLAPLGRMLTDKEAGGPVAFLLDDAASSGVTGHVLVVDGGWSVW